MRKIIGSFLTNSNRRKLIFFLVTFPLVNVLQAQCDPLIAPQLFGPSTTSIFCKDEEIPIGVFYSDTVDTDQFYYFSRYVNGLEVSRKGGPLDGNGGQLSVSAVMRSAADAGEYRVTTSNKCGASAFTSFYVFYGSIDNLSISAWGNNAVTFRWAACGPVPSVTYEYAVTTDFNTPTSNTQTTTDTFASVVPPDLISGTTYYIHVRLNSVIWDGNNIEAANFGSNCNGGNFSWQTIRFVPCAGTASVGTLTPINAITCAGNSPILTATGGTSYRWYKDNDTTAIPGANLSTYSPSLPGQYRSWITTGAGCRGMASTASFTQTPVETGDFFGAGNFYSGDTVRLGINNTSSLQTYKILKDGLEVYSIQGIGNPEESTSPDSIWYKFAITSATQAGLYSVRTTPPNCSAVDFGSAQVSLVTSVTICPGANTSFNFSSVANNTTFKWQVSVGGGSFNDVANNAIYSGAGTTMLILTNPPSTYYGNRYRCVATGGAAVTSSPRTLKFGVTWTGNVNTVWNNTANWNCSVAPGINTDIVIPGGRPRYPNFNSSASFKSLQVLTGATLTIPAGVILTLTNP